MAEKDCFGLMRSILVVGFIHNVSEVKFGTNNLVFLSWLNGGTFIGSGVIIFILYYLHCLITKMFIRVHVELFLNHKLFDHVHVSMNLLKIIEAAYTMHSQSLVGKDPRVICILDSHFHKQFVDYFENSRRNLLILIWFCSLDKTDRNYGDDLGWFGVKRSPRLSAPNYCFLPFACTILVMSVSIIHLAEYYMRVLLWAIKAMGRKGCC